MRTSLKARVVANYLGQGWRSLIGFAFIPWYIKYIGIEAYGLIGIFALLHGWFVLLDMGMRPALSREMARFIGGAHTAQSIRDLLRTVEIISVGIAALIAVLAWASSDWLAYDWIKPDKVPPAVAAHAFALMGLVAAARFVENIFYSSLVGLQHQVLQNALTAAMATIRAVGAIAILAWISPTIIAFFYWQGFVSLLSLCVAAIALYHLLPAASTPPRFSFSVLKDIWQFSAGMMAITMLSLLMMQVDKILLTRLLPLDGFAQYALAGVMSNALLMIMSPITGAYYPRFTELATRADKAALRRAYHQSAQMVTVLMGSAAMILIAFDRDILQLWTNDPALTNQLAPLLRVLVIAVMLNGLMYTPFHLQLAYGWTTLEIRIDLVALAILIPAVLWAVPKFGALGAAWINVATNAAIIAVGIPLMHRRLLVTDKWHWVFHDVAIPMLGACVVAYLCHWFMPGGLGKVGTFVVVLASSLLTLAAAAVLAPAAREQFVPFFGSLFALPGRAKISTNGRRCMDLNDDAVVAGSVPMEKVSSPHDRG